MPNKQLGLLIHSTFDNIFWGIQNDLETSAQPHSNVAKGEGKWVGKRATSEGAACRSLRQAVRGLKSNPPPILVFLGPQNMALFGNRVLADTSHSIRSHWSIMVGPNAMTHVLIRGMETQGRSCGDKEAETTAVLVKKCWGTCGTTGSWKRQ